MLNGVGAVSETSGNLHINLFVFRRRRSAVPDGNLRALGSLIKFRGLLVQSIDIEGNLLQEKLDLPSCKVVFDKNNFIEAKGDALLEDPYNYDADTTVQFQDLGFLNGLVKSFGQEIGLGGKLNASWKGSGPFKEQTGGLELHGDQVRTSTVQNIRFDASAHYQGFNAEVPRLQVFSPYADLDASIRFSPQWFEIPELNVRRSGNTIHGNVKIPLDLQSGRKVPLDLNQPVDVNIQCDRVALDSLQSGKPQVTGTLGFRLQASQTLGNPLIQFTATARDIRATSVSSLSAASGDFSIRIADKVLVADGKFRQPDIHPLGLSKAGCRLDRRANPFRPAVFLTIVLRLSSPSNGLTTIWLSFVKLFRTSRWSKARVGMDVSVNGTIKKPDLAGSIRANYLGECFKPRTDTVPPIADFSTNIMLSSTIACKSAQLRRDWQAEVPSE